MWIRCLNLEFVDLEYGMMKINLSLPLIVFLTSVVILFALACQNNNSADQRIKTDQESATTADTSGQPIQFITGDSLIRIASEASAKTNTLIVYIDNLSKTIFEAAGGPMEEDPARPKLYQDTTISTKILVQQGKGYELMNMIQSTRNELLQLVGNPEELVATLPLKIDVDPPGGKEDWVKVNFQDLPVALVFPKLKKLKSDARVADKMIRESLSD